MIASDNECSFDLSRRELLAATGIAAVAASLIGVGEADAALSVRGFSDPIKAPPVHGWQVADPLPRIGVAARHHRR